MPGLQNIAAASTDVLVPGFSLAAPATASYVLDRTFTTHFPQGSNIYNSTQGQRMMRFVISDATRFLDLSTLRLAFQVTNNVNFPLYATGDPGACWFSRVRLYAGGTLLEDVLYYNRVSSMRRLCKSPQRLWAESVSLLGQTSDNLNDLHWKSNYSGGPSNALIPNLDTGNNTLTIVTPIHAGLLETHYFLPGSFPLTIEIELVASGSQCCAPGRAKDNAGDAATKDKPGVFSTSFTITNARILVDMIQTDVTVLNTFREALAAGRPLQMAASSYSTTLHSVLPAGAGNLSWDITLSRAFSRLREIWITFDNDDSRGVWDTESNHFLSWHGKPDYNLYGNSVPYDPDYGEGFRFQIQCGAHLWPDIPASSHTELFYQLSKTIGMHSNTEGVAIPPGEYLGTSHIVTFNLEKLYNSPGASYIRFTGLNTMAAGDTLRLAWQNVRPRDATATPTRCYITLRYDYVAELRQEGVLCLD